MYSIKAVQFTVASNGNMPKVNEKCRFSTCLLLVQGNTKDLTPLIILSGKTIQWSSAITQIDWLFHSSWWRTLAWGEEIHNSLLLPTQHNYFKSSSPWNAFEEHASDSFKTIRLGIITNKTPLTVSRNFGNKRVVRHRFVGLLAAPGLSGRASKLWCCYTA